jgi:ubiquinone/menaquinone biosynthesis C-methylase UbiE/uncharacterized protein YbaR (Trm112 family)
VIDQIREHLPILKCPLSKQSLRALEMWETDQLNSCIAKRECRHHDGTLVQESLEIGVISLDGKFIYRVQEGSLCMLPDHAILQPNDFSKHEGETEMPASRQDVQEFYDRIGWKKVDEKTYSDASQFEDLRSVSSDYISSCHRRVTRYIQRSGKYILDAASGPVQYEEYLAYSKHYDYRICVDISLLALKEASRKIGKKGLFIQANITNLPLAENCVDAIVSLHTIYHVQSEDQFMAFRELHRVLKPGATAAIVYSWGWRSPLMAFMLLPFAVLRWPLRLLRLLKARRTKPVGTTNEPTLYFFAIDPRDCKENSENSVTSIWWYGGV